jgi:catechol 2,3-dioxygenase-like lactoylglutathione lyase family enzyme
MRIGSMNHLRLTVRDIPEAEAFYDPLLAFMGYRLIQRSAERLAWAMPAVGGFLQWVIVSAAEPGLRDRRHEKLAPGLHHFAFSADDRGQVDAFHELLVAQGANILDPPATYDYEPGYYAVFFADPNGFKLELVHVPAPTPLDAVDLVGGSS